MKNENLHAIANIYINCIYYLWLYFLKNYYNIHNDTIFSRLFSSLTCLSRVRLFSLSFWFFGLYFYILKDKCFNKSLYFYIFPPWICISFFFANHSFIFLYFICIYVYGGFFRLSLYYCNIALIIKCILLFVSLYIPLCCTLVFMYSNIPREIK